MITNLEIIMFYLALIIIVYSIPRIIKSIREVKQWKEAYDERERITQHILKLEDLMYK